MRFVPIFELEDSLLCPLLGAMVEYLKEVLSLILGTEEDGVLLLGLHSGGGEALHAAGVRGGERGDLHFFLGYQKHTGRSLRSCPSV